MSQEGDLGRDIGLGDLGPPAFRAPILADVPAVAPLLEAILLIEGRLFGKDAHARLIGGAEQVLKACQVLARRGRGQHFEKRMAILDGAMAPMEPSSCPIR